MSSPGPTAEPLSLRPVGSVFFVFGAAWGAWVVAAADVQRMLGLSHGGLGLLLSGGLLLAALANAVGGALTERWGTARLLAGSLLVWGSLLVLAATAVPNAVFVILVVGIIAFGGAVDVVMNVAATAGLARRPGSLVRFHARFNLGAASGAAASGILLHQGLSWRWAWAGVGGITAAGYMGLVIGPTLVGWVANAAGLRAGLFLLAVAALFVAAVPALASRS